MDSTLREHYQWLQTIVYALQLPVWTLKEIKRDDAFAYVANFAPSLGVTLHRKDPDFLSTVAFKLSQILAEEEKAASIPENLEELLSAYEEHLEEKRKETLKATFPTLDEEIENLYRKYHQQIKKELSESEKKLAANPVLCEEISHQMAIKIINSLPQTARKEGPGSLSSQDYEMAFIQLSPLIGKEFEKAGIEEAKVYTDRKRTRKFLKNTEEETRELSGTPHSTVSIEKLLLLEKERVITTEVPKAAVFPKIEEIPLFQLKSTGVSVPLYRKPVAFTKKIVLAPVAKPIQWLTHLAPEEIREKNLALTYVARGYTPTAINQTLRYLYRHEPESPEISYWQSLKAVFKAERPPFTSLFDHYYELGTQGKRIVKAEVLGSRRFAKIVTFGRFENFPNLRASFWRLFKGTRFGGWISRGAGKLLLRVGKFASAVSGVGTALLAMDTFKKGMKAAGAYLLGLLMIAAQYGAAAVTGTLIGGVGGGIIGGFIGFKAGGLIGVAIGGPVGMIIGGTVGFLGGLLVQFTWNKVTTGAVSLPQAAATQLTEAGAGATKVASVAMPVATATAVAGGLIVSQVISSAFVIPSEKEYITSPFIQVNKTVEFSGNLGDPIEYTIEVTAVDRDLTQIQIMDQPTATCRGSPPTINEQSWDGNLVLPEGEVWRESYSVTTNDQFNDCLISNTVRVSALADGEPAESFSVGHATIGQPPEVIPWGLPIHDNPQRGSGYTFGQMVPCYGSPGSLCPHEGIDVHGYIDENAPVPVYSTFTSESTVIEVGYGARSGHYIMLSAGKYQIFMGHLAQRPSLSVGATVDPQAPVGIQGDTGRSYGKHVHYMIWENGVIVDPRNFGVPSPPW